MSIFKNVTKTYPSQFSETMTLQKDYSYNFFLPEFMVFANPTRFLNYLHEKQHITENVTLHKSTQPYMVCMNYNVCKVV
jgi:hypothetical protein